jgi:hypothetical protein
MPVPFSPTATNYQVLIGATDITGLIIDWAIESPPATVGAPVTKTFSAAIAANVNYYSGSMLPTNPLWQRGRVLRLFLDGTLFATLRTTRYDYDADDVADIARGQLEASCCLIRESYPRVQVPFGIDWFDGAERETVLPGLTRSVVPWGLATDKFLRRAGLSLHNLDSLPKTLQRTFILGQPAVDGFTAEPPDPNPDPVTQAAEIALGSGYWLTTDEQDRVIAVPYPLNASSASPAIRLPRESLHKFTLQRLETGDNFEPPEIIDVVGRTTREPDQFDPSELDPDDVLDPGDPNQDDEEFQTQPCTEAEYGTIQLANGFIQTYPPRVSKGAAYFEELKVTDTNVLFPDIAGGGRVTEYRRITRTSYDFQGKPLLSTTRLTQPLGLASPTLYPNATELRTTEVITERWTYRLGLVGGKTVNGLWTGYTKDTSKLRDIALDDPDEPSVLTLAEREEVTYFERGCDRWAKVTSNFRLQRREEGVPVLQSIDNPDPEILSAPPEPPYKPELAKPEPAFEVQDDEIIPDTIDPDEEPDRVPRREVISVQAVNSTERAQDLTQLFTDLFQGRRWARIIERAIDDYTIASFRLFEVEDLYTQRFVRDGFAIASAGGITVASYTGQFVGDLITPVTLPTERVLVPVAELTIGAIANFGFTVGQVVNIPLRAVGGVRPYVFSATPLPAGLSVVGEFIVGTVSAAAVTNVTATVTDDDAETDSTGFSITVVAAPVARKRFKRRTRLEAGQQQTGSWQPPTPPIIVEAIQTQRADARAVVFQPIEGLQTQLSDVEIGAAPIVVEARQEQLSRWSEVNIVVETQQAQVSDYEITDVDAPIVVGWVAHAIGTTNQLFVGNAQGNAWNAVTLTNGFANSGSADKQTTDSSPTWVMALGRDTTDSDTRAITRAQTNSDLTNPVNWALHKTGLPASGTIYGLRWLVGTTWICSINNTIYRSTDNGQNWTGVYTLPSGTLRQIANDSAGFTWVIASPVFGTQRVVYSADFGASWTLRSFTGSFGSVTPNTVGWSGTRLAKGRSGTAQPAIASTLDVNADAGWVTVDTGINIAINYLHALGPPIGTAWIAALNNATQSVWVSTDDLGTFTAHNLGFAANGADSDGSLVILACNSGRIARATGSPWSSWTVQQAVTGQTPTLLSITKVLL